jgi:hypothetical protein
MQDIRQLPIVTIAITKLKPDSALEAIAGEHAGAYQ